jgi:phenylalanyl-tRNA synthetase beta subunit
MHRFGTIIESGLISEILGSFGMKDLNWSAPQGDDISWLHPGRSAWVMVGQTRVGFVGELHPDAAVRWQWESEAPIVFELMVDGLYKKLQKQRSQGISLQHQFSKYPGISRDQVFAVLVCRCYSSLEALAMA